MALTAMKKLQPEASERETGPLPASDARFIRRPFVQAFRNHAPMGRKCAGDVIVARIGKAWTKATVKKLQPEASERGTVSFVRATSLLRRVFY